MDDNSHFFDQHVLVLLTEAELRFLTIANEEKDFFFIVVPNSFQRLETL